MKVDTCAVEAGSETVTLIINRSVHVTMSTRQAEFLMQILPDAIHVSKLGDDARNAINASPSNRRLVKTLEANGVLRKGGRIR